MPTHDLYDLAKCPYTAIDGVPPTFQATETVIAPGIDTPDRDTTYHLGVADGTPVVVITERPPFPDDHEETTLVLGYRTAEEARRDRDISITESVEATANLLDTFLLAWGGRNLVAAVPLGHGWRDTHAPCPWRVGVLDDGEPTWADYPDRHAAETAALQAAERIIARLEATGDPVDGIGASWWRSRAAREAEKVYRRQAAARISAAKQARIVDRYGAISNDDLASLLKMSPQMVNRVLTEA